MKRATSLARPSATTILAFFSLLSVSLTHAPETMAAVPRPVGPRPVGPLPFLASVARVRVRVEKDSVVVTHALTLPRGEWTSEDLDLYAAHGAPGAPIALDAKLHHVADGELEAPESDAGEAVLYDRAPRCPESAHPLIGRSRMAGVILHVREAQFRAATASGMAELRVRALYPLPVEDGTSGREVRVRLGIPGGAPLTLGRVQIVASDREMPVARAEARLCGPDAETRPLSISLSPRPTTPAPVTEAPIAPVLAVRHSSDDLCIRFWSPAQLSPKSP